LIIRPHTGTIIVIARHGYIRGTGSEDRFDLRTPHVRVIAVIEVTSMNDKVHTYVIHELKNSIGVRPVVLVAQESYKKSGAFRRVNTGPTLANHSSRTRCVLGARETVLARIDGAVTTEGSTILHALASDTHEARRAGNVRGACRAILTGVHVPIAAERTTLSSTTVSPVGIAH